jgi:hypothetical protein
VKLSKSQVRVSRWDGNLRVSEYFAAETDDVIILNIAFQEPSTVNWENWIGT